jgi:hypothetical protein
MTAVPKPAWKDRTVMRSQSRIASYLCMERVLYVTIMSTREA